MLRCDRALVIVDIDEQRAFFAALGTRVRRVERLDHGVASRLQREQLLEALVDPSARIAPGFGPVQLTLKNGKKLFGTLKEETPTHVVVDVGGDQRVAKSDIATRVNGPSAMPLMSALLTRREIRDVVEYLSTLKAP